MCILIKHGFSFNVCSIFNLDRNSTSSELLEVKFQRIVGWELAMLFTLGGKNASLTTFAKVSLCEIPDFFL